MEPAALFSLSPFSLVHVGIYCMNYIQLKQQHILSIIEFKSFKSVIYTFIQQGHKTLIKSRAWKWKKN